MYVVATGSGHEIHLYQPDPVVGAVERVVVAVRDRVPLAQARPERGREAECCALTRTN